ncbi:hypothetical protein MKW94_030196 [Papaver nudicaule]|uniref:3'-5' exonuclease domain-containing protein n=1 Tax=Papaver nudicaule TaxID=74823 RepID=A0AA41W2B7_PAPNU|nr:hypothetical protein [Papaver nudicaule]
MMAEISPLQNGHENVSSIELLESASTHQTYNVYYYKDKICTTVTHTPSVVDEWIAGVHNASRSKQNKNNLVVVGLDVEWSRIRDDYSCCRNEIAVLQLCLARRCLLFQISCCDNIPKSLHDLLRNEKFIFVGAGIDGDAHKLWVDHRLNVARTEELGSLADFKLTKTDVGYRESRFFNCGLKNLAKVVLNLELPKQKGIQLSNWEDRSLSDQQIEYACLDAFVSFKLAMDLMNRPSPVHTDVEPKKFWKDFSEPKKVEAAKQVSEILADGSKTNDAAKQVSEILADGSKTDEAAKQVSEKANASMTDEAAKQVSDKANANEAITKQVSETEHDFEMVNESEAYSNLSTQRPPKKCSSAGERWSLMRSVFRK